MALENYTSANIGGIKRGDREETGDLEAHETSTADRGGSGSNGGMGGAEGHKTGDASALGESMSSTSGSPLDSDGDLDDLTVMDASDPALGLTNIGMVPPQDWVADTGETVSGESEAPSRRR